MIIETFNLDESNEAVTLTTYVLDDSLEMLQGKKRPGIIICPGGGYFNCSDREAEPMALKFASMGYHTFVLRYTTYCEGEFAMPDLSKPLPVKPERMFPQQIRDLGKAMILVKKHADEWHLDAEQVAVCGFSAGGHNAALYSSLWDQPILTDYLKVDSKILRPAAAILGYPLVDYQLLQADLAKKINPMDVAFMRASNTAFLGAEAPTLEVLKQVSVNEHVTTNTPPMFIWATAKDALVSPKHALVLASSLVDAGCECELHIFQDGGHGLSLATQATSQAKSQIYPDVAVWTDLVDTWLKKQLIINLPEKTAFEEMQAGM